MYSVNIFHLNGDKEYFEVEEAGITVIGYAINTKKKVLNLFIKMMIPAIKRLIYKTALPGDGTQKEGVTRWHRIHK